MKGYKIYLTRSDVVANIIHRCILNNMERGIETIGKITRGCAYGCKELPKYLRTMDYKYVCITYDNLPHPMYEIVFAQRR